MDERVLDAILDRITEDELITRLKLEFSGVFRKDIVRLFKRYLAKGVPYECGRNRCTFIFRTYVVKLPLTDYGISDNDWEGSVSNDPDFTPEPGTEDWYIQYARTRLAQVGSVPVLLMERVEYATYATIMEREGKEPDWIASVDCGQVGYNKSGKLVAFDYGMH